MAQPLKVKLTAKNTKSQIGYFHYKAIGVLYLKYLTLVWFKTFEI